MKGYRTVAFNILAAVPMVVLTILEVVATTPELKVLIPEVLAPVYALAVTVGNIYLRSITTTPMGKK